MVNREYYINMIADKLLWLCSYIDMQKSIGLYDIYKHSEDFFCGFLNLLFELNCIVTYEKNRYAYIPDLIDEEKHIAVEITGSTTISKVKEIIQFFEYYHDYHANENYRLIILLLVSQKPASLARRLLARDKTSFKGFDVINDLLDISDIIDRTKTLSDQELLKIYNYVCDAPIFFNQKQMGDNIVQGNLTDDAPLKSPPIGRTSEISSIETQLQNNTILLITGTAGIGKSTIASHLYYTLKESVDHIGWIRSLGNLEKDLLQLNIFGELQLESLRLSSIIEWLSSGGSKRTYIFIDDYSSMLSTNEEEILQALPHDTKIIFISRLDSISSNLKIKTIEIGPLGLADSRMVYDYYYAHETDTQPEDKIQAILKGTNGNPALIEFISRSQNNSTYLLENSINDINDEIVTEFINSLNFTKEERRILRLLIIMPEQLEIWSSFFEWAEFDKSAVSRLLNLGLINYLESYYVMNPLIRAVLILIAKGAGQEDIPFNYIDYEQLLFKLSKTDSYLEECQSEIDIEKRLNFATVICDCIIKNDLFDDKIAVLLIRIASILKERNSLEEALEYYKFSVQKCETQKGTCDSMLAKGYLGIASILCLLSEYDAAQDFIEKTQELLNSPEIRKPQASELYYDLGCIFVEMRDLDGGEQYLRNAYDLIDFDNSDNKRLAEEIYCTLAEIFFKRGEYERALTMYSSINSINEQASTYNSIALCYHELDRFEEAFHFYLKAYSVAMKRYGSIHPATVIVKNNFRCLLQVTLKLKHVNFGDTEMIEFDFSNLELQEADFKRSQVVKKCSFLEAAFRGADFTYCQLEENDFSRADFSKACFNSARLKGCSFEAADLYGATFEKSRLENIVFKNANLKNVSFYGAEMKNVVFDGAYLQNVIFPKK